MLIDDFALGWIYGRLVYRYWTIVVFFLPLPVLHLSPFQLTLLLGLHFYFKHCRWKNFPWGHCTPNGDQLVWLCFCKYKYCQETLLHNSVYCPLHCIAFMMRQSNVKMVTKKLIQITVLVTPEGDYLFGIAINFLLHQTVY